MEWVVVHSPMVGKMTVVGTFPTEDSAAVYAQTHHEALERWHVVQVTPPVK